MSKANCTSPLAVRIVELIQERARLWRNQEMTEMRAGRLHNSSLFHAKAVECEELLIMIVAERAAGGDQ